MPAPEHVIDLIEKACNEKVEFLDLSNCALTEIPEEIILLAPYLKRLNLGGDFLFKRSKNDFEKSSGSVRYLNLLTKLLVLDVKNCGFTEDLLPALEILFQINSLNIRNNKLTNKGALAIGRCNNLTSLDIGGNFLTDKGAQAIATLKNLTSLDIGGNQLTDKGAVAIAGLQSLVSLDISHSKLNDTGIQAIADLNNLTSLDIESCKLIDLDIPAISNLGNLTSLNISFNELSDAAGPAIANLSNLTSLDISYNILEDVQAIRGLKNLTLLDISSNNLTDKGAQAVGTLSNLASLNLSSNNLTGKGAQAIANLYNLTSLNISSNKLYDSGAKTIARLKDITSINIGYNGLTDKGAQAVANLKKLTSLDISGNGLTDASANAIASLFNLVSLKIELNELTDISAEAIAKLNNLTLLDIADNLLTTSGLATIITSLPNLQHFGFMSNYPSDFPEGIRDNITALREYFLDYDKVDNTLVKLVLIGNTRAGKSSLADFLTERKYTYQRKSTHGIKLWKWKLPQTDLKVNIWDFGGQDYFHATHNLFLTQKTLYLLLHTTRQVHNMYNPADEEHSHYFSDSYWLANIRSMAGEEATIWFIQSKADIEQGSGPGLNSRLRDVFVVQQSFSISVQAAFEGMRENKKIRNTDFNYFLDKLVGELSKLKGGKIPRDWVSIRDKFLPLWKKEALYLPVEVFKKLCSQAVEKRQQSSWEGLLLYLQACGEIIWFNENPALQNKIFLSPETLTEGMHKIVLSEGTLANRGCFTIPDITSPGGELAAILLEVLNAYELVFKKPGKPNEYIAPQYLPENPFSDAFSVEITLSYVIHFPNYLSRSVVSRFMVRYASNTNERYYWRYGAYFELYGINVFVKMDMELLKVFVHVSHGDERIRIIIMKELFYFFTLPSITLFDKWKEHGLRGKMKRKKDSEEIEYVAQIPGDTELSTNGADFVAAAEVRLALRNKVHQIKSSQGNFIEFKAVIYNLFNYEADLPKRIFISYSHVDLKRKNKLIGHFAALEKSNKIAVWHDGQIRPGDKWDDKITMALEDSDIILLLLSADFMHSRYIWEKEIKVAKEHNLIIVPIFLRPCDFEEDQYEIYKQQGLPHDTKWITGPAFKTSDEGYLQVVQGIKELLK